MIFHASDRHCHRPRHRSRDGAADHDRSRDRCDSLLRDTRTRARRCACSARTARPPAACMGGGQRGRGDDAAVHCARAALLYAQRDPAVSAACARAGRRRAAAAAAAAAFAVTPATITTAAATTVDAAAGGSTAGDAAGLPGFFCIRCGSCMLTNAPSSTDAAPAATVRLVSLSRARRLRLARRQQRRRQLHRSTEPPERSAAGAQATRYARILHLRDRALEQSTVRTQIYRHCRACNTVQVSDLPQECSTMRQRKPQVRQTADAVASTATAATPPPTTAVSAARRTIVQHPRPLPSSGRPHRPQQQPPQESGRPHDKLRHMLRASRQNDAKEEDGSSLADFLASLT